MNLNLAYQVDYFLGFSNKLWDVQHMSDNSLQMDISDFKRSRYHSFSGSGKDQKMTVNLAGVGKPKRLNSKVFFFLPEKIHDQNYRTTSEKFSIHLL